MMVRQRQARTAFVTAAVAGSVVLVAGAGLLGLAAGAEGESPRAARGRGEGVGQTVGWAQGVVPPPGAALLFASGLLAIRRGRRK